MVWHQKQRCSKETPCIKQGHDQHRSVARAIHKAAKESEQQESEQDGRIGGIANNKHQQAGNGIDDEEARALSDALEANTSLTSLQM